MEKKLFDILKERGYVKDLTHEKEIIDSAGMMLLNVPSGEHSIYFHYSTPGLKIGACVSAVSILILLIIAIVYRKEDDHEQAKAAE